MSQEIERKFLVCGDYKSYAFASEHIRQGYICSQPEHVVRVRIKGKKGFLTIKGKSKASGLSRYEWEKEIPVEEAEELMELCEPGRIDKTRYLIKAGKHVFEVDEFHAELEGLVLAEVELQQEDEEFERPEWLGKEVTGDAKYYNAMLVKQR